MVNAFGGSLKRAVTAVTVAALLLVSAAGATLTYWGQQRTYATAERLLLDTHGRVLDRLVDMRTRELGKLTDAFVRPKDVQDGLAAGKREDILDAARPPFNRLGPATGLTHLAYFDAGGRPVVALHANADVAAGTVVQRAVHDKRSVAGIEREAGEPVLFVAQPVYRQGELVGVVELGIAVRRLLPEWAQMLGAEGAIVAAGTGPADSERLGGHALFAATAPAVRAVLAAGIDLPPADQATTRTLRANGLRYAVGFHPLRGAGGASEGLVVLSTDVTATLTAIERSLAWSIVAMALMALVVIVVTSRLVARRLRPLGHMVTLLRDIADGEGDLTRRLAAAGRDEVGDLARSFNVFIGKLHDLIAHVRRSTALVASASAEVSISARQLSSSAQRQASSLEETAGSMSQVTAAVKQMADHAQRANGVATEARGTAEQGGAIVKDAVTSMDQIHHASTTIGDIVGTIDGIAFQTNLLALNAAVEAARAGEQGRGFAVVAAEVRALAQRSATAAREIKTLITDSVDKVASGAGLVHRSGEALQQIVGSAREVSTIIETMAAATLEQTHGIDQVNRAVVAMDEVTQASAAESEQLAATAATLADQARELEALVARFTLEAPSEAPAEAPAAVAGAADRATDGYRPAMVRPASMTSVWPVTQRDSSLAR